MSQHRASSARPTVIVTGASLGVGLYAAKSLAARDWFVVMACRDLDKANRVAREQGIAPDHYALLPIDLGSQQSVRAFVDAFHALGRPLHALVNNAAVYLQRLKEPMRYRPRWRCKRRANRWATRRWPSCCAAAAWPLAGKTARKWASCFGAWCSTC